MYLPAQLILLVATALTVVPGLRTIAKAQHPEPTIKKPLSPPPPQAIPLSLPFCAHPAQAKLIHDVGCKKGDAVCACSKKDFLPRLLSATSHSCNTIDQKTVKQFAAMYCGVDPGKVTMAPTKTITRPGKPTETWECSRMGTATGSKKHSTITVSGRTPDSTSETDSTASETGNSKGMIGAAPRQEVGLSAIAFVGVTAVMGWVFAEL